MGGVPWSEGDDPTIHDRIQRLHGALSSETQSVRAEIDAHLLAFYVDRERPNPLLVLTREHTFHYHALPDLMKFMRKSIACNDWTLSTTAVFMAPFCLQIKRQINKRTPMQSTRCERAALLNLLHGLLLGLYPYNLKHMTFDHRVRVAGEIHKLLTGDSDKQKAFIVQNEPLLLVAMIEYLANVIPDFCPVEEQLVIRNIQCRYSLNQLCENFRAAAMEVILDSPNMWERLNRLATVSLPILLRQLKMNNHKFCRRACLPMRIPTTVWATLSDFAFYDTMMGLHHVPVSGCNMIAQIKITRPDLTFAELQAVEYFWNSVFMCSLPSNIVMNQMEVLDQLGSCSVHQRSFTQLHVCLPCALRTKTSMLAQKFAYNCTTGMLQCATCSRKVTPINMLGRILRVKSNSYYLCTKCLHPVMWDGTNTFDQCSHCIKPQAPQHMSTCAVCTHKAVETARNVLQVEKLKLVQVPLCYVHARMFIPTLAYDLRSLANDLHG